ncbi:phage recombination protein Bet [Clostridium sp. LP20]|uniref:phage recombination protein Bet n=1 Tax=Clostridium sp. LP20 TaxID=3418665 RepID=UPI003EE7A97A
MSGAIQKVSYEAGGQRIDLTPATVKQYLVNGDARNVTDQEVGMFLKLCEGQKLNPFLREAYLVKYGNQAATMVVGKDAFTKRAETNENYKGTESGVIVVNLNNEIQERQGTFYLKNREELVGGWAKVKFKDGKEDVYNTVSLDEYIGRKKDGSISSMWNTKPATMIRKVALVQALREAFPNALGQMYTAEEIDIQEELPTDVVDPQEEQRKNEYVPMPPKPADKKTKQQVMQLAAEKDLMVGEGKEADISKLEALAKENGVSLRGMTQEQATNLIEALRNYQEIHEIKEEDIEPVEDETPVVEAEVVEDTDEDDPF